MSKLLVQATLPVFFVSLAAVFRVDCRPSGGAAAVLAVALYRSLN
jgi:hypothetical protein